MAFALALLVAPSPIAFAQPILPDAGEAEAIVTKARKAFEAEQFESSGRLFERAYEMLLERSLPARPSLLFNGALAYEHGDRCDRAADLFERFRKAQPKAAASAGFMDRLHRARECAPLIQIDTTTSNASVSIDARPVGKTPLLLRLKFGTYRLRLTLEGYNPVQQDLTVTRGRPLTLNYDLKPVKVDPINTALQAPGAPKLAAQNPDSVKSLSASTEEQSGFPVLPLVSAVVGAGVAVAGIAIGESTLSDARDGRFEGTTARARAADVMLISGVVWVGGSIVWMFVSG